MFHGESLFSIGFFVWERRVMQFGHGSYEDCSVLILCLPDSGRLSLARFVVRNCL